MTNKNKLAELLAQGQVLASMSTENIDSFSSFIDDLSNKEHDAHGTSTLWRELLMCNNYVVDESRKRATEGFNETFLILLEEFQKRCAPFEDRTP